jgi:hypothetical protein
MQQGYNDGGYVVIISRLWPLPHHSLGWAGGNAECRVPNSEYFTWLGRVFNPHSAIEVAAVQTAHPLGGAGFP